MFVIEGRAPDLKQQVMAKRQETRFPQRKAVGGQRQGGRRNFNACLKEVRYYDKHSFFVFVRPEFIEIEALYHHTKFNLNESLCFKI